MAINPTYDTAIPDTATVTADHADADPYVDTISWPFEVGPSLQTRPYNDDPDRATINNTPQPRRGSQAARSGRVYPDRPLVNGQTTWILTEAVRDLAALRCPTGTGDFLAELHALSSLMVQAEDFLPDVVVDARSQGRSWTEIACQLGISPATAARRYRSAATRWGHPGIASSGTHHPSFGVRPSGLDLDQATRAVVVEAFCALGALRPPPVGLTGPLAHLEVLLILVAQVQALVCSVVTDAREEGSSWAEIGCWLGLTPSAARRRYGAPGAGQPTWA